jgi:hypothetical protein
MMDASDVVSGGARVRAENMAIMKALAQVVTPGNVPQ